MAVCLGKREALQPVLQQHTIVYRRFNLGPIVNVTEDRHQHAELPSFHRNNSPVRVTLALPMHSQENSTDHKITAGPINKCFYLSINYLINIKMSFICLANSQGSRNNQTP